jgi:hypothetical protein
VALRNRIFTAINGDEGMLFPDATVSGKVLFVLFVVFGKRETVTHHDHRHA